MKVAKKARVERLAHQGPQFTKLQQGAVNMIRKALAEGKTKILFDVQRFGNRYKNPKFMDVVDAIGDVLSHGTVMREIGDWAFAEYELTVYVLVRIAAPGEPSAYDHPEFFYVDESALEPEEE